MVSLPICIKLCLLLVKSINVISLQLCFLLLQLLQLSSLLVQLHSQITALSNLSIDNLMQETEVMPGIKPISWVTLSPSSAQRGRPHISPAPGLYAR